MPEETLDAILRECAQKEDAGLRRVVAEAGLEPWLICDTLLARGAAACARRVAGVVTGPDAEGLRAYLEKASETDAVRAGREALAKARAALDEDRIDEALHVLDSLTTPSPCPLRIAKEETLARALGEAHRAKEQIDALERGAVCAAEIGWRSKQLECLWLCAGFELTGLEDPPAAQTRFEQVHAHAKEAGHDYWRAQAASGLGTVAGLRGDATRAVGWFEEAARSSESLGDLPSAALSFADLAVAYQRIGSYALALRTIDRAWALAKEVPAQPPRPDVAIRVLTWRAGLRVELGHTALAVEDMREAHRRLEVAQKSGQSEVVAPLVGDVHGQLAYALLQDGNPRDALPHSDAAIEFFRAVHDLPGLALATANGALIARASGEPERAIEGARDAWLAALAGGDPASALAIQSELAEGLRQANSTRAAEILHLDALAGAESLGAHGLEVSQWAGLVRSRAKEQDDVGCVFAARQLADAVGRVIGGLGDEESAVARGGLAAAFHDGMAAAVRLGDVPSAARLAEAGRAGALLEALGGRTRLSALTLSADVREELRRVAADESRAQRAFLEAASSEEGGARGARLAELRRAQSAYAELVSRVQRDAKARAGLAYPTVDDLDRLRSYLGAGDLLVLYSLPEAGSEGPALAVWIRPGAAGTATLGSASHVRETARALTEESSDRFDEAPTDEARQLLAGFLPMGPDVKRVLISPEGELAWVPWARLLVRERAEGKDDPAEDPDVLLVPSGSVLGELQRQRDRMRGAKRGGEVLAVGDPDYTHGLGGVPREQLPYSERLRDLPGSRREALAVSSHPLLGREASEGEFRRHLESVPAGERLPAILLAAHGLFDEGAPLRSAIALTVDGDDDGRLTALEVAQLNVPADLVVLSACESGRGGDAPGEGVLGLVRAFMFAGVPTVLATLWKVDDEATEVLVTHFFTRLRAGDPPAAALRAAQAEVRSKYPDAYYWAAWVLWGLPD